MFRRVCVPLCTIILAILITACGKDDSPTAPLTTTGSRLTISGRVDSTLGHPIAGATVRVIGGESTSGTSATDAEGLYAVPGIAVGNVTVTAEAAGFTSASETFAAVLSDARRDLRLASTTRYAMFGVVRDSGNNQPLSGVTVQVTHVASGTNVSTTTDGGGFYHLAGILAGASSVVSWSREGYVTRDALFSMSEGDRRSDVTLQAAPPQVEYRITGTARRCSVTYQNQAGSASQTAVTIPWSYTRTARTNDFLSVSCQIDTAGDTGNIEVAIRRNGNQVRSATANGFPNIATASFSY